MLNFLQPYWLSIVKWGGIALAAVGLFFGIRKSGRDAERVDAMERSVENVSESKKVRRGIANSSSDSVNQRLRDKWTRD